VPSDGSPECENDITSPTSAAHPRPGTAARPRWSRVAWSPSFVPKEQVEHRPVHLVALRVLVVHVGPLAVEWSVGATQVPYGPAPAGFFKQLQPVRHPAERHRVGRFLVVAKLAHVHPDALRLQAFPHPDTLVSQRSPVTQPVRGLDRPCRLRPRVRAREPGSPPVTHLPRVVGMEALGHAQVDDPLDRRPAQVQAIGDDQPVRVARSDRGDEGPDHIRVRVVVDLLRLVHQVEGQPRVGDAPIPFGEVGPVVSAEALGLLAPPQVQGLPWQVDAVPRRPVKAEGDVDPVSLAEPDSLVDLREHRLLEAVPIGFVRPEPVVERQPHEIEAIARDEGEVLLAEPPVRLGTEFLLKVEAAPAGQSRRGWLRGVRRGQAPAPPHRGIIGTSGLMSGPKNAITMRSSSPVLRISTPLVARSWVTRNSS
jgi:hypothetical protein